MSLRAPVRLLRAKNDESGFALVVLATATFLISFVALNAYRYGVATTNASEEVVLQEILNSVPSQLYRHADDTVSHEVSYSEQLNASGSGIEYDPDVYVNWMSSLETRVRDQLFHGRSDANYVVTHGLRYYVWDIYDYDEYQARRSVEIREEDENSDQNLAALGTEEIIFGVQPRRYSCKFRKGADKYFSDDANTAFQISGGQTVSGYNQAAASARLRNRCDQEIALLGVNGCHFNPTLQVTPAVFCVGTDVYYTRGQITDKPQSISACDCRFVAKDRTSKTVFSFAPDIRVGGGGSELEMGGRLGDEEREPPPYQGNEDPPSKSNK